MPELTHSFTLVLRQSLFAEVKKKLEADANCSLSDEEVTAFLTKRVDILGSIVHHDELDATDRQRIWAEQRTNELC